MENETEEAIKMQKLKKRTAHLLETEDAFYIGALKRD